MDEVAPTRPGATRLPGDQSAPAAADAPGAAGVPGAADVLSAMRAFRTAETAMRRRTRGSMGMGENDLLAVQFLMRRQQGGQHVSPKDLAAYLGISSASTTVLIDRLVKSGHVVRQPHPSDRRAIRIIATPTSHREVRETLDDMNQRMLEAAEQLSTEEARAVIGFLQTVREIVELPGDHGDVLDEYVDHELAPARRRA